MIRGVVAGVVGLGLIGGVGAVTYADDGTATVAADEHNTANHKKEDAPVKLPTDAGEAWSCPADMHQKTKAAASEAGRIKLTLDRVHKRVVAFEAAHSGHTLPPKEYEEYQRLRTRHDALAKGFSESVNRHNAIIKANCTK